MTAYYNEIDEYPADWLENLIREKLIAPGVVDRRCITKVDPRDLKGFSQVHLFAGIGGWSLTFRRAGIRDDEHAWSVSCPCPPWSRARIWHRESEGKKDKRDLWPAVMPLVRHWRPKIIYGEQVAGKKVEPWIRRTQRNLKGEGYAFFGEPRKAKDYGAPSGRERFYFSADLGGARGQGLVPPADIGAARPWRWGGETDLRAIAEAPFERGHSWPQPLVRRGDDGLSARVGRLRAYGNAIDPWVAAQFVADAREVMR